MFILVLALLRLLLGSAVLPMIYIHLVNIGSTSLPIAVEYVFSFLVLFFIWDSVIFDITYIISSSLQKKEAYHLVEEMEEKGLKLENNMVMFLALAITTISFLISTLMF